MQRRQPRGHFVLFTSRLGLQRGVNVRARIFRHGKFHRMIRRAKRVAGVRVLEFFHRRANVARAETRHRLARPAVEQKNLPMRSVMLRLALNKSPPVVICPE